MILVLNLAATLFLTGLAWSLQFVQLPLLPPDRIVWHRRRNSSLMIVPMAVEGATAAWLAWQGGAFLQLALLLWFAIGVCTAAYTRSSLSNRIEGMKSSNAIRVVLWTFRAILVGYVLLKSPDAR